MLKSIAQEMEMREGYLGDELVESIYFGGGTPSLLKIDEIENLLDLIRKNHTIADKAEVTLEAKVVDYIL